MRAELDAMRARYDAYLRDMLFNSLLARLPPSLRAPLGEVRLEMPAEWPAGLGGNAPDFVLNAGSLARTRQVILPIRTVLWLDEYAGLTAEMERRDCDGRTILPLLYAHMLTRVAPGAPRPPGPFAAFGLDDAIYADARVKDTSNKLFATALFFLLAHELGHIAAGPLPPATGYDAQQRERDADRYALDAMAQVGLMPWGLVMLFTALAVMEGGQTTHPMSGSRVEAAARAVEARPRAFVDRTERDPAAWEPRVLQLMQEIRRAIPLADDPAARAGIARTAGGASFAQLRDVARRSCPRSG
jgi:hypothetical protein